MTGVEPGRGAGNHNPIMFEDETALPPRLRGDVRSDFSSADSTRGGFFVFDMSASLLSYVWDLDLHPEVKLVALALADQAVDREVVSVSIEIIARKVCIPLKRLNEIYRGLDGYGLIVDQSETQMRLKYNFTQLAEAMSKMKRGEA